MRHRLWTRCAKANATPNYSQRSYKPHVLIAHNNVLNKDHEVKQTNPNQTKPESETKPTFDLFSCLYARYRSSRLEVTLCGPWRRPQSLSLIQTGRAVTAKALHPHLGIWQSWSVTKWLVSMWMCSPRFESYARTCISLCDPHARMMEPVAHGAHVASTPTLTPFHRTTNGTVRSNC